MTKKIDCNNYDTSHDFDTQGTELKSHDRVIWEIKIAQLMKLEDQNCTIIILERLKMQLSQKRVNEKTN